MLKYLSLKPNRRSRRKRRSGELVRNKRGVVMIWMLVCFFSTILPNSYVEILSLQVMTLRKSGHRWISFLIRRDLKKEISLSHEDTMRTWDSTQLLTTRDWIPWSALPWLWFYAVTQSPQRNWDGNISGAEWLQGLELTQEKHTARSHLLVMWRTGTPPHTQSYRCPRLSHRMLYYLHINLHTFSHIH